MFLLPQREDCMILSSDTLHLELVLQCFNSLHLDATEDTQRVKAVIDDNNNNRIGYQHVTDGQTELQWLIQHSALQAMWPRCKNA